MSGHASTSVQVAELSICPNCRHNVPTTNLFLHEANCNRNRSHASAQETTTQQQSSNVHIEEGELQLQPLQQQTEVEGEEADPELQQQTEEVVMEERISHISALRDTSRSIHLGENEWQCPRCTLINTNTCYNCNACLAPRNNNNDNTNNRSSYTNTTIRPSDQSRNQRLVGGSDEIVDNGWVNVTYNPQFQRGGWALNGVGTPGATRTNLNNRNNNNGGRIGTITRIFNGAVNGAIFGSVFAGTGGMILGSLAGAIGGVMVARNTHDNEDDQLRETHEVANMLATDGGGISRNSVRVHRTSDYITALTRDRNGRNRIIRVRHNDNSNNNNNNNGAAQPMQHQLTSDLERSLLEVLVAMSYQQTGPGFNNVILQPEESYDELIQRFGLGTENRGASQEVIDSYPVEVVTARPRIRKDEEVEEERGGNETSSKKRKFNDAKTGEEDAGMENIEEEKTKTTSGDDEAISLGTCGICLEDYKEGDLKKTLSCQHNYHPDCIDKWLKLVATCPTCKHSVGSDAG